MVRNIVLYGISGYNTTQLQKIKDYTQELEEYTIILMEDAVIGTTKTNNPKEHHPFQELLDNNRTIYFLQEDLIARGYNLEQVYEDFVPITYEKLIDLIETTEHLLSWL